MVIERMKRALEYLYCDVCSVYEKDTVVLDGRTSFVKRIRYEKIPCRLSSKTYLFGENAGSEKKKQLRVSKKTKLFLPPEYEILPGSEIVVESRGRRLVFTNSGAMSFFASHNEVMVEIMKDYA